MRAATLQQDTDPAEAQAIPLLISPLLLTYPHLRTNAIEWQLSLQFSPLSSHYGAYEVAGQINGSAL